MYKNGCDLRVCVNGRPTREYSHDGLIFVESRHGTNYTIKIKNDNGYRVMAIVSVDGLDVISGKPAESVDTGYVVSGYSSTEIKGYRITDGESAAFVFYSKGESYTKDVTGNVRNAGVIGVRVFREKEQPITMAWFQPMPKQYPDPWNPNKYNPNILRSHSRKLGGQPDVDMAVYCSSVQSKGLVGSTFDSAQLTSANFDTGTAWGDQQSDKVKRVEFDKGELITESVIYYASSKALKKIGIDLTDEPLVGSTPDKMPKPFGNSGYCTPPKNWNKKR